MNKNLRAFILAVAIVTFATSCSKTTPATEAQQTGDEQLQSHFNQIMGFQGDPHIQFFRDRGESAVAFLARHLKSTDSSNGLKAVKALRQLGSSFTGSDVGLAALTGALEHPDAEVRSIAEGALGDLGPRAKAAVPALIKCVAGGTDINGVWALGRIGPDAKAALPYLEPKMRQETGRERVYAAGAVWAIGGENAEAKAVVEKASEDSDKHIQIDAKNVLAEHPEIGSR